MLWNETSCRVSGLWENVGKIDWEQIMPQLLYKLKVEKENDFINTIDWGILTVYTCPKTCVSEDAYKEEFLWRQNYSANAEEEEDTEEEDEDDEDDEEKSV
jgi:hypothetical protein